MGNTRGLGFHLIFICVFMVVNTYTCLGVGNMSVVCSEQERLALFKFKHSIKDPYGILSSWVGNDCCWWERIQCDIVTGSVESVNLRGYFSYGRKEGYLVIHEVNPSLAELRHLKYLDLSGNFFPGRSRIPEFIGSFKQLSYLNLSNVGFQGIVPHHLGNLSNLKVLDLSSNKDLMAIDMAWTSGLSSLEHLDLSLLNLRRVHNLDMVFYMIPSLKVLSLSDCGLSNADLRPSINSSRILPNIRHLNLSRNFFKGPVPRFFQNMTSIAFLDLSDFDLSLEWNFANMLSLIPSVSKLHLSYCGVDNTRLSPPHLNFSTLSNIQHLDLSSNSIEGIFPSVFTNMSSLRVLDLSGNRLNSSVPVMPNLVELDLSYNQFQHIEQLGIWRQCRLKKSSASYNHFDFDIKISDSPKNVSECSQYALERLDLHGSLSGTIPEPLGRLTNLRSLDLSFNLLTGPIPESLGRLSFLEVLDLSFNRLTGPIPTFRGKLSKLDLSYNKLNGLIPESFGKFATLTDLNLDSNLLTGPIPASLGRLVSLQAISLYSNLLNGTIPVSLGQLAKLQSLDISYNSLEGIVLEAHFANLSMLKELDISSNKKLTFNVSCEWVPPFKLVRLQLQSCNIGNEFPYWLRTQRTLESLSLSNATISGPLPRWLRKMPIIHFLDLSHNKLSGSLTNLPDGGIFDVFGDGYSIGALFLENNLFSESIPKSLCRRTDLQYFDFSRNRLSGKIPRCLENLQNIRHMIFSSNQLSGFIPRSIALKSLYQLKLNDNNFIGELPRELGNLRQLDILDLGENKFSGNIPEWIGGLTFLSVLRLHKNNFTGRIPHSMCKTSYLRILDVAYNNLTGTIPHCLGKLSGMVIAKTLFYGTPDGDDNVFQVLKGADLEYTKTLYMVFNMDLSSNKLEGEIPVELTSLSMLMGLNLSNNHLSGGIPESIGNMSKLESLDFSNNELIGIIPSSMANLNFLSHLNLSNNNLSGQIPTGNQLQTLTDPSIYAGNKDLCGPPLPHNCLLIHEDPPTTPEKKYEATDEATNVWLYYVDVMSGFATGFWGVIGVLVFKKQWRQKLFMFAEETVEKIYVAVLVRVAMMKRGREAI